MRVRDSLGQLRVAGRDVDFYSDVSQRPFPYKSEDELIDQGIETDLVPPWGDMPDKDSQPAYLWPDYVKPPDIPSLEEEVYKYRQGDARRLWPYAGTWNWNILSTKRLNKTKYPPSPAMSGLGRNQLYRRSPMLIADSDLGQTTIARRGAGNMFGPGHFSVTSFPRAAGGDEMFGNLGEESLFGDESVFGFGQDAAADKVILKLDAAKKIRSLGNFAAGAGGAALAFVSMSGRPQAAQVALGVLGAGLGAMALLSLGMTLGLVDLGG